MLRRLVGELLQLPGAHVDSNLHDGQHLGMHPHARIGAG